MGLYLILVSPILHYYSHEKSEGYKITQQVYGITTFIVNILVAPQVP